MKPSLRNSRKCFFCREPKVLTRGVVILNATMETVYAHAGCFPNPLDVSSGRDTTTCMELFVEKMIRDLVGRLDKIAKKNRDTFRYRMEIHNVNNIRYRFIAEETAERHEFTSGYGFTIQEAVKAAEDGIPEALKQWGYKDAR